MKNLLFIVFTAVILLGNLACTCTDDKEREYYLITTLETKRVDSAQSDHGEVSYYLGDTTVKIWDGMLECITSKGDTLLKGPYDYKLKKVIKWMMLSKCPSPEPAALTHLRQLKRMINATEVDSCLFRPIFYNGHMCFDFHCKFGLVAIDMDSAIADTTIDIVVKNAKKQWLSPLSHQNWSKKDKRAILDSLITKTDTIYHRSYQKLR